MMNESTKLSEYPGVTLHDDPDIEVTLHQESTSGSGLWDEAKSIARDILFAAVLAVLILIFVIQPVKVEGTSMQPRLDNDERIFVNKFKYYFEPIDRGDIIVFWYPDDPTKSFIKRVIGLPGETIKMDHTGQLSIDGRNIDEPYISADRNLVPRAFDQHIKAHYYFVMGDNRDASNDSRNWGLVPEKYIYGKAMFRYWPVPRMGLLN